MLIRAVVAGMVAVLVAATSGASAAQHENLRVRVYVLDFDPVLDNGVPLTVDRRWNDPIALDDQYRSDVAAASGGVVGQRIAWTSVVRAYPVKPGAFTFTNAQYLNCLIDSTPSQCGALIDYATVLNTAYDERLGSACDALMKGRVDEVWLWGGPWFGYLESASSRRARYARR